MVKLINKFTGTEMWVAELRLDEYLAAGHKLAVGDTTTEPQQAPAKPKKKPAKK